MRLSVASLRRVVKGDLTIEFVPQALTSYGGLELLGRYLRRIDLGARLRQAFAGLRSDYGSARIALVLLALFYVGARRLEHLRYLGGDPLVTRFCGLARLPTRAHRGRLVAPVHPGDAGARSSPLNRDLVTEALARLELPRLTIDVDGSVIRTGATVGWAFRGFNPHHRKDPSYYPLVAHVAQTGHILRLKNRPGNVHDSKQAVPFLRELIDDLRARFGRRVALEFRMDAAFFQRGILQLLAAPGLWLRDQGRLLELAAAQGDRRRLPPLAAGRPRRHRPRDRAGHPAVETSGSAWCCTGSTSTTRRAGTSSWICSPPMTATTSTPPSPRTCRWASPALWAFACGRGRAGEDLRRTQGRVRARRGPDQALRGQQRLILSPAPGE